MRRFKSAGLCLVAVFALGAVMASGAQAGQIGKCVKAAKNGKKYTGHYVDNRCKTHATVAEETQGKTNKYEWVPDTANIPFTSEGGESKWKFGPGEDVCERVADKGEYLPGGVEDTDTLTFTGCRIPTFELSCQSEGAKAGEIVTYELASRFIDHGEKGPGGKEPAEGEVWEELTNDGEHPSAFGMGPWLAAFECGPGVVYALSGSISGVVQASYVNAKLKVGKPGPKGKPGKWTFVENFTAAGGEQDLGVTAYNPQENEVEVDPLDLEFTNGVMINPIEKGLEISGAV